MGHDPVGADVAGVGPGALGDRERDLGLGDGQHADGAGAEGLGQPVGAGAVAPGAHEEDPLRPELGEELGDARLGAGSEHDPLGAVEVEATSHGSRQVEQEGLDVAVRLERDALGVDDRTVRLLKCIAHSDFPQGTLALMQDLRWDDLRVFLAIAREGSLSGAARTLGVNHSTAWRRPKALEETVGALFERDGYALTPIGEATLPHAERVEEEVFALERAIAGTSESPAGPVRVTAPESMLALLAPILVDFGTAHPQVRVDP